MNTQWETLSIPFVSGISPNTRDRLLSPQKLLKAQNCFYFNNGGPEKRYGHVTKRVITNATPTPLNGVVYPGDTPPPPRDNYSTDNPNLPASWLFGWGIIGTDPVSGATLPAIFGGGTIGAWGVSEHREAGLLFGQAIRDNEVLPWDGHRLFSYAPDQSALFGESYVPPNRGPAVMPLMRAQPIAKMATSQTQPDSADNGVVRTVAWISPGNVVNYSVYDSVSGACLVANGIFQMQGPKTVRVLTVGAWTHILIADQTATLLTRRSFHQDSPETVVTADVGNMSAHYFDVKKVSETLWFVATVNTGVITITEHAVDGTIITTITPNLGVGAVAQNCALAINRSNHIGLLWYDSNATQYIFGDYDFGGHRLTHLSRWQHQQIQLLVLELPSLHDICKRW
jgi:hypothetical protein